MAAYRDVFTRLGVGSVEAVDPGSRAAASDPDLVAQVDAATGVFMTGGNQLKLSQYVVGTPLGDAILRAHRRGAVVAGTSAGASIMSLFMISMGEEGVTPRQRASQLYRRAGPAAGRGRGPALRPAGPLRPAALDRGHLAEPARPGHRRGHRRGGHRRLGPHRARHRGGVRRRRARGRERRTGGAPRRAAAGVGRGRALPAHRRYLRPAHGHARGRSWSGTPTSMVKAEVQDEKDTSEATAALRAH